MPRPMKPTGRAVVLLSVGALLLAGCDGDADGTTGSPPPSTTSAVPTPAETFTGAPGTATYGYANEGIVVTFDMEGSTGTLHVENGSPYDLDPPDLYVLDALDGHRIEVDVLDAVGVGAGETASFEAELDDVTVDDIGLLVLLFGADNYGAFVRTA